MSQRADPESEAAPTPGRVSRLFVAAMPPEDVLDLIERLPREPQEGVRYTSRDQWHATLRFLGRCEESAAASALSAVEVPPAEVRLGPEVTRLGRGVVVIPASGLDRVAAAVVDATAGIGEPPDDRRFNGHITVARLRGRQASRLVGAKISATFVADRIHLMRSSLDPDGARYQVLATFLLRTGQGSAQPPGGE